MADEGFFVMGCMGTRKLKICIDPSATLQDLAVKVNEVFYVNPAKQKIIFKGKLLKDFETSLRSYDIKSGDCIMILGKVKDPAKQDSLSKELEEFERQLRDEEVAVATIVRDVTPKDGATRKLLHVNEKLMKLLETIDGTHTEVSQEAVRGKRKAIVQGIQRLMDRVDQHISHLDSPKGSSLS